MRRIWFWEPSFYWFGWRTLVPVYFGSDEFNRKCVVVGWTITGRIVLAISRYTTLRIIDGPKELRETLCVAQNCIAAAHYDLRGAQGHISRLNLLINECDRHRPLGPDGTHGDLHTRTCGCEDK